MELIPVLSTIILVATITTFILAIGAYILYKRRETKGEQYTSFRRSPEVPAELITPSGIVNAVPVQESGRVFEHIETERVPAPERMIVSPGLRSGTIKNTFKESSKKSTVERYQKYTSEGYISAKDDDQKGSLRWR